MCDFSVVIPIYRCNESLFDLSNELNNVFNSLNKNFEIIFVFDGGLDSCYNNAVKTAKLTNYTAIVKLTRNFGQHNAIIAGIEMSKGNWIITMDEDKQHHPDDIKLLINQQLVTEADVVYGSYSEKNHSFFRNNTSKIMQKLLKFSIPDLYNHYSAFRLIRMDIARKIIDMRNSYTFLDGYLSWVTNNISHVDVRHLQSEAGESSYNLKKLVNHSLNIFFTFSSIPIRLITFLSLILFGVTFIYTVFIVISALIFSNYKSGFPTLVALIGFGFSFVLLGIGVLGEYIHRINLKSTNRPNYIISKPR